jgi:two-component sensor histidine kinase
VDITDRKHADEVIKSLLAEKELILREVHHRIKNNMNAMTAILSLQARKMEDRAAVAAFEDAGERMQSMQVLYDMLYQSASFSELSIMSYLPTLVDALLPNFPGFESVTVEKRIDDVILDVKHLQPLGLIVNELLTNSMKYAFTDAGGGHIVVSATRAAGRLIVVVQDDGKGLPESVSFENPSGFGLRLVQTFTKQLQGTIRIERGNGTKVILEFDL